MIIRVKQGKGRKQRYSFYLPICLNCCCQTQGSSAAGLAVFKV
jgi:hypothetical protein